MATFDRINQKVRSIVGAKVPQFVISKRTLEAAQTVLKESFIWKERVSIPLSPGTTSVQLPAADKRYFLIDRRTGCYINRKSVNVVTYEELVNLIETGNAPDSEPTKVALSVSDNTLLFYPAPANSVTLIAYLYCNVSDATTTLPDEVEDQAYMAIADYAAYLLFDEPGEIWSDPRLSEKYKMRALIDVSRLKARASSVGANKIARTYDTTGSRIRNLRYR